MAYTSEQAKILTQALPYIQKYSGKTIVIKYGGHAMVDEQLKQSVMRDIILLRCVGMNPILVHGGGPEITDMMKKVGKEPAFVNGLRVTDAETMEIVEMVLSGKINKSLVSLINQQGGSAVGLSGKDANLIVAEKAQPEGADIGFVGQVKQINPQILETLAGEGYIPVISSVAIGANGESLNMNADHVAGALSNALGAVKLIMMTDVKGIYDDKNDKSTLQPFLRAIDVRKMIQEGKIDKGMIPKVEACLAAVGSGKVKGRVERAHIIDGSIPHALLMEIFTDTGIGTMIQNTNILIKKNRGR
ncbi:MAG: acetylglutamate kinase [Armatimonadota bacterium]|nr:acetylglutamate kinase [Armatimonadota bacterium]